MMMVELIIMHQCYCIIFLLCDSLHLITVFCHVIRRKTSVDESYEWDSADACGEPEVLDTTRTNCCRMSLQRQQSKLTPDQFTGVQDQRQKGILFLLP